MHPLFSQLEFVANASLAQIAARALSQTEPGILSFASNLPGPLLGVLSLAFVSAAIALMIELKVERSGD
ncbi:MAG: hypothetical protein ACX94B_13790 [Henriciella sp.]